MNLSQTTISAWEKKDTNVKVEHIFKLAQVLRVATKNLLTDCNGEQNLEQLHTTQRDAEGAQNVNVENTKTEQEIIESLKLAIKSLEDAMKQLNKNKQ